MATRRHGRGAAARRVLCAAREAAAAGRGVPPPRRAARDRDRLQSRHLADHLAAADHEHGGDAVPPDGRRMPRRRDAQRRARARPHATSARSKPASAAISRSGTSSARPSSSIASASIRCMRACGGADDPHARQGPARRLARDRARRGVQPRSRRDAGGRGERRGRRGDRRRRASRSTASTPASESSRACASRRTSSASCSATSCSRMRPASARRCARANVRLMMALKLASLARGASGVRPATLALHAADARARRDPGGAEARLGRRLGRSRAARAHDRRDARRRRGLLRRRAHAGRRGARARRPRRRSCSARRKASRCSTARSSRPPRRWPALFAIERVFQAALDHRRARDRCGEGLRHAVRSAHPRAARPSRARSRSRTRCAR